MANASGPIGPPVEPSRVYVRRVDHVAVVPEGGRGAAAGGRPQRRGLEEHEVAPAPSRAARRRARTASARAYRRDRAACWSSPKAFGSFMRSKPATAEERAKNAAPGGPPSSRSACASPPRPARERPRRRRSRRPAPPGWPPRAPGSQRAASPASVAHAGAPSQPSAGASPRDRPPPAARRATGPTRPGAGRRSSRCRSRARRDDRGLDPLQVRPVVDAGPRLDPRPGHEKPHGVPADRRHATPDPCAPAGTRCGSGCPSSTRPARSRSRPAAGPPARARPRSGPRRAGRARRGGVRGGGPGAWPRARRARSRARPGARARRPRLCGSRSRRRP